MNFRVVYLEPVPDDLAKIIRSCLPPNFDLHIRRPDEAVEEVLPSADFVLVATTPLPSSTLVKAVGLRLIQHQGVGYDKTDVAAAAGQGIPVALCPAGTSIGVAEHVFLLILALYKKLCQAEASLRAGSWLQWELRPCSYEMAGKTVGIVGLGRIGHEVAYRARAFAADVIYNDVNRLPEEVEKDLGVRFVKLTGLLEQVDILTLHLPLTAASRHMIGKPELQQMKPSAILINTARGLLVDENALVEALKTGQIGGAGLDVFSEEPLPVDHPLLSLPNVVLTPHIAAGTVDALVIKMKACFENMLRVTRGEAPIDVVTTAIS
jgi:phosphoglycerate dehydrogenase-like enzyme